MADIRLIVADLDGTIIGPKDEHEIYAPFRLKLEELRQRFGTRWSVNTGRSKKSFKRAYTPLASLGITPDFVIVKHAYVYSVKLWGYRPHYLWNIQTWLAIIRTRVHSRILIGRFAATIASRFRRVKCIRRGPSKMLFRFRDTETMESAYYLLRVLTQPHGNLIISQYSTDLVLSTIPFTKGVAVAHLAAHIGVSRENVLCIGDGHNDMSMLDGSIAGMTACPANATSEVMRTVHRSKGHISAKFSLAGTLEAIDAHTNGGVNSKFPADFRELESAAAARPLPAGSDGHRHLTEGSLVKDILLFTACAAAALFALASCSLLGPLSQVLMRPIDMVAAFLARLTSNLL